MQVGGAGDLQGIAGAECSAIRLYRSLRHMHIHAPAIFHDEIGCFIAVEEPGVNARVLVNQQRFLRAIGRDDEPQSPALLRRPEALLFVARLDVCFVRLNPDLQKVRALGARGIEFAMPDAAAGTHSLHVSRPDGRSVAHGVLVGKLAG